MYTGCNTATKRKRNNNNKKLTTATKKKQQKKEHNAIATSYTALTCIQNKLEIIQDKLSDLH